MESEEQDVEIQVTDEAVNTNTASENQEMSDVLIVTEFYNAESESASEKRKLVRLPLARVKQMMKTDMECALISQDAVFLVTKATELFIELLSRETVKQTLATKRKTVLRKDVDGAIDNTPQLCFLDGALE